MRAEPPAAPKGFLLKHACPRGGVGEYTPRARARRSRGRTRMKRSVFPSQPGSWGGEQPGGRGAGRSRAGAGLRGRFPSRGERGTPRLGCHAEPRFLLAP